MADVTMPFVPVKFILQIDGKVDQEMSLEGQPEEKTFEVKEGTNYRMTVEYYVRHKIVSGMRFHMEMKYKGIKNDKETFMVGSVGPQEEPHRYTSPAMEAPKGMVYRGHYKIYTKLLDDDHNSFDWQWGLEVVR